MFITKVRYHAELPARMGNGDRACPLARCHVPGPLGDGGRRRRSRSASGLSTCQRRAKNFKGITTEAGQRRDEFQLSPILTPFAPFREADDGGSGPASTADVLQDGVQRRPYTRHEHLVNTDPLRSTLKAPSADGISATRLRTVPGQRHAAAVAPSSGSTGIISRGNSRTATRAVHEHAVVELADHAGRPRNKRARRLRAACWRRRHVPRSGSPRPARSGAFWTR